jgi:hypothetical protein
MRHAAFACSLVLSGCCFNPFPYVPPDAGVAPDSGVTVDGGADDGGVGDGGLDDGGATDSGFVFDGGLAQCPALSNDGGSEPPTERFVADSLTLPDCTVRGVRVDPQSPCEAKQRVIGLWRRCSTALTGQLPMDAELLEIRDTSWHQLEVTDAGVMRRLDLDGSGRLDFFENRASPALIQVNVQTPQGGWHYWHPGFEAQPDRMRITYYPANVVDFARAAVP